MPHPIVGKKYKNKNDGKIVEVISIDGDCIWIGKPGFPTGIGSYIWRETFDHHYERAED